MHYLHPGEVMIAKAPGVIHTVLGSCVAVTLHDPQKRLGGICHAMLPTGGAEGEYRFLDRALSFMVLRLEQLGVDRDQLQARIYGGSDMFDCGNPLDTVGAKNIAMADQMLEQYGLCAQTRDVGGDIGRRLQFLPHTGQVQVHKVGGVERRRL